MMIKPFLLYGIGLYCIIKHGIVDIK